MDLLVQYLPTMLDMGFEVLVPNSFLMHQQHTLTSNQRMARQCVYRAPGIDRSSMASKSSNYQIFKSFKVLNDSHSGYITASVLALAVLPFFTSIKTASKHTKTSHTTPPSTPSTQLSICTTPRRHHQHQIINIIKSHCRHHGSNLINDRPSAH